MVYVRSRIEPALTGEITAEKSTCARKNVLSDAESVQNRGNFSGARRARWASHQLSAAAPPTFAKFRARWGAPNFFISFRESLTRA